MKLKKGVLDCNPRSKAALTSSNQPAWPSKVVSQAPAHQRDQKAVPTILRNDTRAEPLDQLLELLSRDSASVKQHTSIAKLYELVGL